MRKAFICGSVLAVAMALSAAPVLAAPDQAPLGPAAVSTAPPAQAGNRAAATFGPGLRESARQAVPAALRPRSHTDVLNGDTCYLEAVWGCYAVGYYFDFFAGGAEGSLGEAWDQGASAWVFSGPADYANITLPYAVSCAWHNGIASSCMVVGQHTYNSLRYAAQLAEE